MAFINKKIYCLPEDFQLDIRTVVEFVERWNKKDEEREVAEAASRILNVLWEEEKEQEKSDLIDNLSSPQEELLKEAHAKDYHGTDDDMPDAYEVWIIDLSLDELKTILTDRYPRKNGNINPEGTIELS